MDGYRVEEAAASYGIDAWGAGYLSVNEDGCLDVLPTRDPAKRVNLLKVVEELQRGRIRTPVLVRFPQILDAQLKHLLDSFERAMKEFNFEQPYYPVFPMKVNQQQTVVESLLAAGYSRRLGIEAGSKPELIASLALELSDEALTVCNGFKDVDYLSIACLGARMGRNMVVVIEKPFELDAFLAMAGREEVLPNIGFRIRLRAKGSGLWEKSGGASSKFGLTTNQLLDAIDVLRKQKLLHLLKMFHFHIGSQITEIRRIKDAIKEGARIYAKARRMGVNVEYLNVGGGLGVDYDGSRTSSDASVNYTMEEYANDVVYNISDVCENEHVPRPKIVTETGRALVAYHSCLVTDVRGAITGGSTSGRKPAFSDAEHKVIDDLLYIFREINVKNYREYYHDAIERRDEMYSLFDLGLLDLEDRAKGEWLFWTIAGKAVKFSKSAKFVADEFVELETRLYDKLICNFSVFQSIPDHWALDQLFPVIPIHRLNERPANRATLVDITCDSDGEVEKFVDLKDIKPALEVHSPNGAPYYVAFFLIGAYQDTMGDLHNLFGAVNEAQVVIDDSGKVVFQNAKKGESVRRTLECYGYDSQRLMKSLKASLQDRVGKGRLDERNASRIAETYKKYFDMYPYLS